ncbi:hypothetical protein PTSG_01436 [Salpingoeca rosetta]|uniref:Uncharacterized protein n=1 Tax=Salpingoeca rosetta (strain ATCC 50818 / BSB-021) TaxID=946362 RepID=F2U0C2_SALR5|nr:uncharacterized protein PTSG_01436 [Salpingoeca rosetta]EGD80850.1 hypothetical protein PTSG_01436 [Salpingoeca rosetta]|eukprot:XP_004997411.1 hypothetical protein PTSG_01436 [Salpingoeca rosetta]
MSTQSTLFARQASQQPSSRVSTTHLTWEPKQAALGFIVGVRVHLRIRTMAQDEAAMLHEFEHLKAERYKLEVQECEAELRSVESGTHAELVSEWEDINKEEAEELRKLDEWRDKALASAKLIRFTLEDEAQRTFEEELRLVQEELCEAYKRDQESTVLQYLFDKQKPELMQATAETKKLFPHLWEQSSRKRQDAGGKHKHKHKHKHDASQKKQAQQGQPGQERLPAGQQQQQQQHAETPRQRRRRQLPPIVHMLHPFDIHQDLFLLQRTS